MEADDADLVALQAGSRIEISDDDGWVHLHDHQAFQDLGINPPAFNVTAHNPSAEQLSARENVQHNQQLLSAIGDAGIPHRHARAGANQHWEEGFAPRPQQRQSRGPDYREPGFGCRRRG